MILVTAVKYSRHFHCFFVLFFIFLKFIHQKNINERHTNQAQEMTLMSLALVLTCLVISLCFVCCIPENETNKPDRRESKTLLTIGDRGYKSLETVFSIVICRRSGDKWQSKSLFLTTFDPRSSTYTQWP